MTRALRLRLVVVAASALALGVVGSAWAAPVSLFPFDEGSGITTANAVPGVNSGTLYAQRAGGQMPEWVTGKFGSALQFSSDYPTANLSNAVDVTTSGFPNSTGGLLVGSSSFWIKQPTTTTTWGTVLSGLSNDPVTQAYNQWFQINTGMSPNRSTFNGYEDYLQLFMWMPSGHMFEYCGQPATTWRDDQWHNIVMTWNVDTGRSSTWTASTIRPSSR